MGSKTISDLGPASKTLMSFAGEMASQSSLPLLDAGCGYGRNATALASCGLSVVCVDQNLDRLNALVRLAPNHIARLRQPECKIGELYPVLAELDPFRWPFCENCFAGIICVHFLNVALFGAFRSSLAVGGYLYIETFGGHGENYLDLPKAGQLHDLLSKDFNLPFYRERKVGPARCDAVAVKLFAQKQSSFSVSTEDEALEYPVDNRSV
jgi:SAM-dependent methyltransferase